MRIEELLRTASVEQAQPRQSERQKLEAMKKLWLASRPIRPDDAAGRYLYRCCGLTEYPPCLRFVPSMRYHDDRPSFHPGMVAMIVAPDGTPTGLHRTYRTVDGHKAVVASARRLMSGSIARGAAVRLAKLAKFWARAYLPPNTGKLRDGHERHLLHLRSHYEALF